jgi:osmotically-inducible protein OsmY
MKLLFVQNVASINYKITTVNKTVYLIGVAQDKEENQKVLNIVAKISGVKKVVNHVILIDDNRRE